MSDNLIMLQQCRLKVKIFTCSYCYVELSMKRILNHIKYFRTLTEVDASLPSIYKMSKSSSYQNSKSASLVKSRKLKATQVDI